MQWCTDLLLLDSGGVPEQPLHGQTHVKDMQSLG